jgi:hypothetical protein
MAGGRRDVKLLDPREQNHRAGAEAMEGGCPVRMDIIEEGQPLLEMSVRDGEKNPNFPFLLHSNLLPLLPISQT